MDYVNNRALLDFDMNCFFSFNVGGSGDLIFSSYNNGEIVMFIDSAITLPTVGPLVSGTSVKYGWHYGGEVKRRDACVDMGIDRVIVVIVVIVEGKGHTQGA